MQVLTKMKLQGAWRSKTNYTALAVIVIGFLLQPEQQALIARLFGPSVLPTAISVLGLVLLILRWYSGGLEEKSPDTDPPEPPQERTELDQVGP